MGFLFEIIFQFLAEVLIQVLAEALAELGCRSLTNPFKKPRNPILSTIGHFLWGAIAGGISLLIFSSSFITDSQLKIANLIFAPIVLGGIMMLIGGLRKRQGKVLVKLDQFGYACIFAFGMSLVRFIWAD